MTRCVIWDLDGTLVDSLHGIALSLNHALAQLGHPQYEVAAIRSFIGNGSHDLSRRAAPPGAAPEIVDAIEAAFKADYSTRWVEGTVPYPGMIECVEKLHAAGIRQAVLSNKPHPFTTEIVARIFPPGVFEIVLGQKPDFPKKPAPQAALHIIDKLDIATYECRFVGDSSVDCETADRAGIPFLLVCWGYEKAEEAEQLAGCERMADAAILTQRLLS